jgi:hypothetical protein
MFEKMCKQHQLMFATSMVGTNTWELFNVNELDPSAKQLINQDVGVWNVLSTMQATLGLFKTLTNFSVWKFNEHSSLMTPTIQAHVQATSKTHIVVGWLTKLTTNQQLFQFILYVKHGNVIMYDIFL